MALNLALKQFIETKLAHTRAPQWELPITEVRQAFRNLWVPPSRVSWSPHRGRYDSRESVCRTAEDCRSCDPLHLRRRHGARFSADARHRSGRTDRDRGNRALLELKCASPSSTAATSRTYHPPVVSAARRRPPASEEWRPAPARRR